MKIRVLMFSDDESTSKEFAVKTAFKQLRVKEGFMFGLMKAKYCNTSSDTRRLNRLHYCGTCKTMGSLYGQTSRLLLNHDTVFVGELLSLLQYQPKSLFDWDKAFHSYNCFYLPQSTQEIPISLQFAATVNVVLAEIRVDDNMTDSNFRLWKLVRSLLSKKFRLATGQMKQWSFPLHDLWQWANIQKQREKIIEQFDTMLPDEKIAYFAEPTAVMTGLTFMHGARIVKSEASMKGMYNLGYSFGKLIYLLDAFEDYKKDNEGNHFNALQVAFGISANQLPHEFRQKITKYLFALSSQIEDRIMQLPVLKTYSENFIERLKANLSSKLMNPLKIIQNDYYTNSTKAKLTLSERWQYARQSAKSFIDKKLSENPEFVLPSYKLVAISVLITLATFINQESQSHPNVILAENCENWTWLCGLLSCCCIGRLACICVQGCCGCDD